MKKSLSCFIILLSLSLWSSVSSAEEWCCHWGSPIFNSDVLTPSGNPVSIGNGGQATSASFIAEKLAEVERQKAEVCKNKAQKIADADSRASQCKLDAQNTFVTKASECTQITKATISIGGQNSFNGDINRTLAAFNIKVGALISGNVSGTLEWNPNADCRIKLDDTRVLTKESCDSTAITTKAKFAGCP